MSWFRPEDKNAAAIVQAARKRATGDPAQPPAESPEPTAESPQVTARPAAGSRETTGNRGNGHAAEEAPPSRSATDDTKGVVPEALQAPHPTLPATVQSRITSDNTVAVRMRISRSGKVIRATVASASGPESSSVAHYAIAAAYRWRFRPTRENGKTVQTEKVVEFQFHP